MKRLLFLCLACLSVYVHADVRSTTDTLVSRLASDYRSAHPDQVFQKTLGILVPESSDEALVQARIGEAIAAFMKDKLARATIFILVERANLGKLLEEIEFTESGLVDPASIKDSGKLLGADLLLVSKLTSLGSDIQVSAQLVDTESGRIEASGSATYPRADLVASADAYVRSTFQSPNGIFIRPSIAYASTVKEYLMQDHNNEANFVGTPGRPPMFIPELDLGYRFFPWLSAGLGLSSVQIAQFFLGSGQVSFADGSTTTRYITFSALGPSLFAEANIAPTAQLNLGLKAVGILFLNPSITYDLTQVPVVVPDWTVPATPTVEKGYQRITVVGFRHLFPDYALRVAATADYLISERLSLGLALGYYYQPPFTPTSFSSPHNTRDETDTSINGIFPEYMNFDFSRIDGTAASGIASYDFSALTVEFGLGLHF